jgi:hypothetical protein
MPSPPIATVHHEFGQLCRPHVGVIGTAGGRRERPHEPVLLLGVLDLIASGKCSGEEVVAGRSMRAIVLELIGVVLAASLLLVAPANAVEVQFIPFTAASELDARTYRAIWEESGERIVAAFEAVTCLPFAESIVRAVVAERVSNSGGPEHPMKLRASYVRAVKQATLVHELGHRVLWQLTKRFAGVDGHRTLYLVLDRVWAYVWGEKFAEQRIRDESGWLASYDYGAAWRWARSLRREERVRLWNELLIKNGFPGGCDGSLDIAARQSLQPESIRCGTACSTGSRPKGALESAP